jgi:DNA-binding response OmpR family regulator
MVKTVLYIGEKKEDIETIKPVLEKEGYELIIANNGKDCLKDLNNNPEIDLIILSIPLQDTNGWKLYQKIRKKIKKKNAKTKVVFLSEIPVIKERLEEFRKRGVSDYIVKPFDNDELLKRIKAII